MKRYLISITIVLILCIDIIAQDNTRFIVFGDTQFGNPPEFERMVYEASLFNPDFVIQVGDLIHGYTHDKEQLRKEWKRYKGQISLLNSQFYPVPGNHDVVTDEAEEVYEEVWGKDKLLYSFNKGSSHFVVLNSWWGEEDDRILEWQRDWLAKDLSDYSSQYNKSELSKKSIFVFVHSPLWKYSMSHEGRKDWDIIHNILRNYPVKLVVSGHTHEYVHTLKNGINYIVINSAGVSKENIQGGKFSSFLHVDAEDNGEVHFAVIKAGSVYPLDTVDSLDRIQANKFNIEEKTILIENWIPDEPLKKELHIEIENSLNHNRLFRLDWFIPYGAEIIIEPESKWVDLEAKTKISESFLITSNNAPSTEFMPYLEVTTQAEYRTGYLSRDLEAKYKNNPPDIDGYNSSIKLDDNFIFEGKYKIFIPPTVTVKKLNGELNIDGIFSEKFWQFADSLVFLDSDSILTKLKFLYDKNYLFIAALMEEPFPAQLKSSAEGEIPLTWNDDDIELFFDTERTQKDYIRLFQNSVGTRFNSLQRWVDNKYFISNYESNIHINKKSWTIEFKIPWSDIDLIEGPNAGDKWAFNVGRHRQQSTTKQSKWSGGLYNPREYGLMKFE